MEHHVVKDHIFVGLLSYEKTTKTYYFTFVREYLTNVLPYSPPLIILKITFLDKINIVANYIKGCMGRNQTCHTGHFSAVKAATEH